ncbi:MAG: hypothetical protein LBF84_03810 [Holosporales bacterium]|jgi:hypothetical protein|nr:hypothetical protein [Holosporales bacterium]
MLNHLVRRVIFLPIAFAASFHCCHAAEGVELSSCAAASAQVTQVTQVVELVGVAAIVGIALVTFDATSRVVEIDARPFYPLLTYALVRCCPGPFTDEISKVLAACVAASFFSFFVSAVQSAVQSLALPENWLGGMIFSAVTDIANDLKEDASKISGQLSKPALKELSAPLFLFIVASCMQAWKS